MSVPVKPNVTQTYQVYLYGRALHPELFQIKARRVIKHGAYEFEAWLMQGMHLLRFEHRTMCAAELLVDHEGNLPCTGAVAAFLCAGERDFEHKFPKDRAGYMCTVQTETLSENLYISTLNELRAHARETDALVHQWRDEAGPCLSMLDIQRYAKEVHAQSFHLIAQSGLVLRTQTLFEHE